MCSSDLFSKMTEAEYTEEVMANLHDDEHIYRTMLRDVYQNGLVLQKRKGNQDNQR